MIRCGQLAILQAFGLCSPVQPTFSAPWRHIIARVGETVPTTHPPSPSVPRHPGRSHWLCLRFLMASKKSGGFSQVLIQKIGWPHSWHLGRQLSFRTGAGLDILGIRGSHGGLLFLQLLQGGEQDTHAFGEVGMQISHGWIQTIEKIEHPLQIQVSFWTAGPFRLRFRWNVALNSNSRALLTMEGTLAPLAAASHAAASVRIGGPVRSLPPRYSLPRAWRDPPNHRLSHRQMVRQMLSEGIGWQLPSRRWNPPTRLYHEPSRCLAPHDFPRNLRQNQWRAQGTQIIKGTPTTRPGITSMARKLATDTGTHCASFSSGLSFPGASKSFLGPRGPCIHCLGGHPTWAKLQMPKISRKTSGKSTRLIMMFFIAQCPTSFLGFV